MDFIFSFPMRVRDYECDIQGIVNNANYFHYFEACRHEFIESRGVEFADLHRRGIDVVVAQAELKFKRSLQPRDYFEVRLAMEKRGLRYSFLQEIVRSVDQVRAATDPSYAKEQVCVRAQTDIVSVVNGRLAECAELYESSIMSDFIDSQLFSPSPRRDFRRAKGLFHSRPPSRGQSPICHKIIIFA